MGVIWYRGIYLCFVECNAVELVVVKCRDGYLGVVTFHWVQLVVVACS